MSGNTHSLTSEGGAPGLPETFADLFIVDADSHWSEPPDLFTSRAPASIRDRMPRVEEVDGCLADLASIGVDIVTIGQYLRPTSNHVPVARWIEPDEFDRWKVVGEAFGIGHVESSPLTRSSYHARAAADGVSEPIPVSVGVRVS